MVNDLNYVNVIDAIGKRYNSKMSESEFTEFKN
jgi:hypothetical protein